MIFSNKKEKDLEKQSISLKIDNTQKQRVRTFTYLGVVLDEQLTYEAHIKQTISRVSAKLYQLRRIRQYVTDRAALLIYKNMILPILEYGDLYMHSANMEHRKKLQTLQNRALKCALNRDKRYSTKLLHSEARILKLNLRRKKHILLQMYQCSTYLLEVRTRTKLCNYPSY